MTFRSRMPHAYTRRTRHQPMVRAGAHAFTLIELSMLIAVVGVLAAILVPVLSAVRMQALRTESINNLRQVYTALVTYSHDHAGKLPNGHLAKDPGQGRNYTNWRDTLAAGGYLGQNNKKVKFDPTKGDNYTVLGSPLQRELAVDLFNQLSTPSFATFSMNGTLNSANRGKETPEFSFNQFTEPARTMLVMEGAVEGSSWFRTTIYRAWRPEYVGDDVAIAYADGSVRLMPTNEFPTRGNSGTSLSKAAQDLFWNGTQ